MSFDVTASFYSYKSGIFTGPDCGTTNKINHAMQAVGFGWDGDTQFVILRNNWKATWGESGYIRVALNDSKYGPCGLYYQANAV